MESLLIYKNLCPNCGREIQSERLEAGTLCEKCIQDIHLSPCDVITSGRFLQTCLLRERIKEFEKLFLEKVEGEMWSIQRTWATRFFSSVSFATLAPTGIGKTTFGLVLSFYIAKRGGKVYLLFPTEVLVLQAEERLRRFGLGDEVVFYASSLPPSLKRRAKERIKDGDFQVLITTTGFLYRNANIIPRGVFELIFVDDVDSLLKTSKNIDRIFYLMGIGEDDINYVLRNIPRKKNPLYDERISEIRKRIKGSLLVSSATAKVRTKRVLLLKELLGFEVGGYSLSVRNVTELYKFSDSVLKDTIGFVKRLGTGGLVFLPAIHRREVGVYKEVLNAEGIRAESYDKKGAFEAFKRGECDVLIGLSSYNNPLARGIDIPERVRYAIFAGVPRMEFTLKIEESPSALLTLLRVLLPSLMREGMIEREKFREIHYKLRFLKDYRFTGYEGVPPQIQKNLIELRDWAVQLLLKEEVRDLISRSEELPIQFQGERLMLIVPDTTGYVQASGRTSRLFMDRLTKGLSILLVDSVKAFRALTKKMRWIEEEFEFKELVDVDLEEILREVDRDRERVFKGSRGRDEVKTTLVIVESPNKARTIAHFFGTPSIREVEGVSVYEIPTHKRHFMIAATRGHIFDLTKEGGYYGVICKDEKFIPVFEMIDETRLRTVEALRKLSLEVDEVLIATDPDTEGEKIAYDVFLSIRPYNSNIKRTEFHEVTRRAFAEAVETSRDVNINLVKAQLLRRVADRWIGFKTSEFIQRALHQPKLSAGRVQTPVLNWIVERYEGLKNKLYIAQINFDGVQIEFEFGEKKEALEFLERAEEVEVSEISREEDYFRTLPYTTSTLLKDAANILRFSPQKTMELAQELFERGLITYHRTDSYRVSHSGINVASTYIKEHFGERFFEPKQFVEAGGAHECIRPTRPLDINSLEEDFITGNYTLGKEHLKLYELIFRHFIASQMKQARVEKKRFRVSVAGREGELEFITSVLEDGNNLVIPVSVRVLAPGKYKVKGKRVFKRSRISPYNFSAIVERMKSEGIGRPSTYAVTIQKLFERKYVVERGGFLFPTKLGRLVNAVLKSESKLSRFVDEEFTRELERQMDEVEEDGSLYNKYLLSLYRMLAL